MAKRLDLTGMVFGRLTVVGFSDVTPSRKVRWDCLCECGNLTKSTTGNLKQGISKSCGCYKAERIRVDKFQHGRSGSSPTYGTWTAMRQRCMNANHPKYPSYGGRGISICPSWSVFLNFLADMGERPDGKTIDRIDVDGNYEPGNCRWATAKEQRNNQRKAN